MLSALHRRGEIGSTAPSKLNENDVRAFIRWSRSQRHSNAYISKNLTFLKPVCEYSGNFVFTKMKARGEELPKKTPKDLKALSEEELGLILRKADGLKRWEGEVCRFLVYMYPYTGLRPSELRLAQIEDLDTVGGGLRSGIPRANCGMPRRGRRPYCPPPGRRCSAFWRQEVSG